MTPCACFQEDYDAAGEKFWELAQIAHEEGDRSMEMTCYKNIGTCLIYLEEANEALHHWHKALQVTILMCMVLPLHLDSFELLI